MDEEASIFAETFSTHEHDASSIMDIYDCKEYLSTSLTGTHQYFKPDQHYISINITLFYTKITRETVYISPYDHSTFDSTIYESTHVFGIDPDTEQIDDYAQEDFKIRIGRDLVLCEEYAEQVSMDIVRFARDFVRGTAGCNNVFDLDFTLDLLHCHALVPMNIWEVSNDVPGSGMVPATEESIRRLKQRRVGEGSEQNCVICMEDFLKGSKAVSMPCWHSFHGGCIEEWLKRSHYCPICRFEMPSNEQQFVT